MKISLQATMVIAAIFAALCLGVAISGFTSIADITDPVQAADARGFAWFWTFLGGIAMAIGLLGWRLTRGPSDDADA